MKKITLFTCLFFVFTANTVVAQKSLIKQLEVKENRFFYKPIANRYIRASDIDFDNSAYMDIKLEANDVITIDVFALNEDEGGWVKSTSVHGTNFNLNHKYVKLQNEVYIVEDAIGETEINLNVRDKPSFLLYTKEKGVYYHSYTSDNNSGWGAYTTTKDKNKEKKAASELLKKYDDLFAAEVYAFNNNASKHIINTILAKKDEGFTSDWHKANAGKLLFGNSITPNNVNTAATYKTKFAINEPIMVSIFADKGFNKYVDATEKDATKIENFNSNGESTFKINLTFSNGVKLSRYVYIKHPTNKFITLYIHDLLYAKAKAKNAEDNKWIKDEAKLDGLKSEVQVKAELFTAGNEPYKIAEGTFSFIPKAGAVMPYGRSCSPGEDYKIDNLAKVKPLLLANLKAALAKKPATSKLQITEFAIRSFWQETADLPYKFVEVNFVVKNEKGECLSGADKYLWFEPKKPVEQAGYYLRAESKVGEIESIISTLYPYCDCNK